MRRMRLHDSQMHDFMETPVTISSTAITVYYAQIHHEAAATNFVACQWCYNSTALRIIAQAPQAMSPADEWTMANLRPYTYVCRSVKRLFVPHVSFIERQSHRRSPLWDKSICASSRKLFSSFSAAYFLLFILPPFKHRKIHRGAFEFSLFELTSKATFIVSGYGSQYGPCARRSSPDLCFLFAYPHRHTSDGLSPSKP